MNRRDLLRGGASAPLGALLGRTVAPRAASAADAPGAPGPGPFDGATVRRLAQTLAKLREGLLKDE